MVERTPQFWLINMQNKQLYIRQFCEITKQNLKLNGEVIHSSDSEDFNHFAKEIYTDQQWNYPKFYKMDALSKLAFIASELVLENHHDPDTAILFANRSASLDTDCKHQTSIASETDYYPSPAVFVYTLPNITIGEVSIRHDLKSESIFLVDETYPAELVHLQANYLLSSKKATQVLCGWVDYFQNKYQAFVYLVGEEGNYPLTNKFINERIKHL